MAPDPQDLTLAYDPLPSAELVRLVTDSLVMANFASTGVSAWSPCNFFLRNPRGEVLGGLLGEVWGGWLHVRILWVHEAARGHGWGSRLLDAAESLAQERGATAATLETHSFQAPAFYQKRGYQVFGQLDDYPPGHAKLFLKKALVLP